MLLRRSMFLISVAIVGFRGTVLSADEKPVATLAHIRLHGNLDESPVAEDPLFGTSTENFQNKLDRIHKAAKDKNIQGLFLELDGLGIGWGKLHELRKAIADFRGSGKKSFAYLESGDTKDFLLAIACDEVCLPESGWLMLTGLRAEVSFYKDLLDKIGVKADMLQIGDYKGTGEVLTRTSMSPQFRERLESVLDDHFEKDLVELIAKSRASKKLTTERVKALIDQGPFTARAAAEAGLIDRVVYLEQFQETLKSDLKAEQVKISKNYGHAKEEEIDFSNPFAIFKLFKPPTKAGTKGPAIAVIYASGVIVTGKSVESVLGGETVGSTTLIEAIRQAEKDRNVKAIVLRVDSPGGSALASDLIWNQLSQSKKPVVASMSDVAASGGYYISMAAQKIFAEPGTLTGSIGVVGGKIVIGGLYDTLGLKTEVITRGAHAGILSSTSPFSDSERKAMTTLMMDVYVQFVDKAIKGREKAGKKFERSDFLKLAEGRVWTGRQAKARGLVDELGTLEEAIAAAKVMAGMAKDAEVELLLLPKPRNFIDMLLESRSETRLPYSAMKNLPVFRAFPEISDPAKSVEALLQLRSEPVWTILPGRVQVR
jgi:protease-4